MGFLLGSLAISAVVPVLLSLWVGPGALIAALLPPALAIYWSRVGTYVDSDGLTLRDFFRTRRTKWSEVKAFEVGEADNGLRFYRAGFVLLHDGTRLRLPLVSETKFAPDEPDALIAQLQSDAGGL
jgi:PH (Pleckstrin Homology) domain-containing protein